MPPPRPASDDAIYVMYAYGYVTITVCPRWAALTTFVRHLKSYLIFSVVIPYRARLGCDHINTLYKFTITYLLTWPASTTNQSGLVTLTFRP